MALNPGSHDYVLWELEISNLSSLSLFAYLCSKATHRLPFSVWWAWIRCWWWNHPIEPRAGIKYKQGNWTKLEEWITSSFQEGLCGKNTTGTLTILEPETRPVMENYESVGQLNRRPTPRGKSQIKEMKIDIIFFIPIHRGQGETILLLVGLWIGMATWKGCLESHSEAYLSPHIWWFRLMQTTKSLAITQGRGGGGVLPCYDLFILSKS